MSNDLLQPADRLRFAPVLPQNASNFTFTAAVWTSEQERIIFFALNSFAGLMNACIDFTPPVAGIPIAECAVPAGMRQQPIVNPHMQLTAIPVIRGQNAIDRDSFPPCVAGTSKRRMIRKVVNVVISQ